MIIGIDARFYGPVGKGLGRYTQEISDKIIELSQQRKELDLSFVVFLSPANFNHFKIESDRVVKVMVSFSWYSLAEQIKFPWYIKKYKIDLMHFPHFNIAVFCPCKFVVTIHDLILTRFPTKRATTKSSLVYFLKNIAYRIVLFFALKRSSKIITVSEFTKKDLLSLFKIKAEKIILTYEGVSQLEAKKNNPFLKELQGSDLELSNLPEKFLLYVGSAYPHKNLERLLLAFKSLKDKGSDINLVLVGKEDYFYKRLKEYALKMNLLEKDEKGFSSVIFTGHVSDFYLRELYSRALAFIFPSLYEGFGLPPLEAISRSCPVISSNKASLPEIVGPAALYFNPEDLDDMAKKIEIISNNENLRLELNKIGAQWIKKYSWNECAKLTLDVYLNILNK